MHAMRSATRIRFRGISPPYSAGGSSSRSKAVFLSALATLGASNTSTASALSGSTLSGMSSAITMSGAKLLATSAASTLAVTLMMPQGVMCSGRRGGDEDNDGDGKGNENLKSLLRIAKGVFLGDDDADDKSRRAKAGKDRGGDDAENAKKLVQDLVDAFNGFGKDVTQAVDGAVKRKSKPAGGDGLGEAVRERLNALMESGVPAQISFGFGMGFCCGFAAKKTAKVALVGIGLAFGGLQVLSYMGYVELDYSKIEDEVMTSLDLNDDGKVDSDDVNEIWDRTMKVLSYNLPTGSGFATGALVGARMG